jgi:hypothetical protein
MYFPRGAADIDIQRRDLPEDVGNERGEPVVEDRQVRIGAMPGVSGDEIPSVGSEQVGAHSTLLIRPFAVISRMYTFMF